MGRGIVDHAIRQLNGPLYLRQRGKNLVLEPCHDYVRLFDDAGAHVVKVYPVGVAGGPAYIRVIRDPLPAIPMLAAGGTNLENIVAFFEAGAIACGLGAALADPALVAAGDFDAIESRARAFVARAAQHPAT